MFQAIDGKTFIITGVAGFIGSSLAEKILETTKNSIVIGVDNYDAYYSAEMKKSRISRLVKNPRFSFFNDVFYGTDFIQALTQFSGPKVVIHTAAKVGLRGGEENSADYLQANTMDTHKLLCQLRQMDNVEQIIIFSSSSVYGDSPELPFKESDPFSLSTHLSLYGVSKLSMELLVQHFAMSSSVPVTVVRPFNIYGPNGRPDMLPMKILTYALSEKTLDVYGDNQSNRRDWTYIDDCTELVLQIVARPKKLEIVNIGTGVSIGIEEVIELAKKVLSEQHKIYLQTRSAHGTRLDARVTCADISKAKKLYDYAPKYDFHKGFMKTIEYFFQHKELYSEKI